MNAEFVNAYLKKQKALIDDLQTRLLISETSLEIASQEIASLKTVLDTQSQKKSKSTSVNE